MRREHNEMANKENSDFLSEFFNVKCDPFDAVKPVAKKNPYVEYAEQYKCSIAQAIHDRDWPLTREECRTEFLKATGREPDASEMVQMRPDCRENE